MIYKRAILCKSYEDDEVDIPNACKDNIFDKDLG